MRGNYVMKRVLLIGNKNFGISFFKTKTYPDMIKNYVLSKREVQIRLGDEIVKVEAVNKIIKEFSEEERKFIGYDNPKVLMITYENDELLLKILRDSDIPKGLFADDFGTLVKLEDFIEKLKNN